MAVLSTSSSTEEWYVGINGVPVGPVRLAELRRKAASGAISEESLVWREGFEEWVPLRTFPELSALLRDSSAPRTSLTPTPPPAPAVAPRSVAPPAPWVPSPPGRAPARPGLSAVAGRSNVVPISSRRATAEKIEAESAEEALAIETVEPEAAEAPAPAPTPAVIDDELRLSGVGTSPRRRRTVHPAAWAVVGLLGVLVGMSLFLFVTPKPVPVQVVSVMVPAAPTAPPTASAESADESAVSIGPIEIGGSTSKAGGTGARTKATEPAAGSPAPPVNPSLSGLSGLVAGPSAGGGTKAGGTGGALAAQDLERVVQSHRPFVKRQCWEPALGAKPPNAPSSARVMVALDIAGDGHVQNATATGGDGYPGLASCVQSQVRNWKFPPSDGASVKVPFVFAAQ
jgi:hypothetical protein